MSEGADALADRMVVLGAAGHPFGTTAQVADRFKSEARLGGDLPRALKQAGVDPAFAATVERAGAGDLVRVLDGLIDVTGEAALLRRALRSAATYPLLLAACVALSAAVILTAGLPAARLLAAVTGRADPAGGVALVVASAAVPALLALAMAGLARGPLSAFRVLHECAERAVFLTCASLLAGEGLALPHALRTASVWLGAASQRRAETLALALERGAAVPGGAPLLPPSSCGLLMSAAQRGVAPAVLDALATQVRVDLRVRQPGQISRYQTLALALAGVALAAVAASFYWSYSSALLD